MDKVQKYNSFNNSHEIIRQHHIWKLEKFVRYSLKLGNIDRLVEELQ